MRRSRHRPTRRTAPTSSRADAPGEVLDVLRLIWSIGHGLQVSSRRMSRRLGVTGPQRLVLRLVASGHASAPGELAERLVLHKSTVSGIVARLERRGLLDRDRHARDGRRIRLSVTPAGRRLARTREGTIEAAVNVAITEASAGELRAGRAFLRRLAETFIEPAAAPRRRRRRSRRTNAPRE